MPDIFDTINGVSRLSDPNEEQQFQQWYANYAKQLNLNPDPNDPLHFYDYRAAYKAGAKPDESGHWPSQFKLEGHPRMIVDGVNTKTGQPVTDIFDTIKGDESISKNAFVRQGALTAKAFNEATAGFMDRLDKMATKVSELTGWDKGGLFAAARDRYLANAEEWNQKAGSYGKLDDVVGELLGGTIPGVIEFTLNAPYAALTSYAETDSPLKALEAGAERAALGGILHGINKLKILPRTLLSAMVGGGQAALEGGSPEEIAKGAAILGVFGATATGGKKIGLRDAGKEFVESVPAARRIFEKRDAKERAAAQSYKIVQDIFDTIKGETNAGETGTQTAQDSRGEAEGRNVVDTQGGNEAGRNGPIRVRNIGEPAQEGQDLRPSFFGGPEPSGRVQMPENAQDRPEFLGGERRRQAYDPGGAPVVEPGPPVVNGVPQPERRGMADAQTANRGHYAERQPSQFGLELPELVEIAQSMNEGKVPEVVKNMRDKLGAFKYSDAGADILLRPDLMIGDRVDITAIRAKGKTADARKQNVDEQFENYKQRVTRDSGVDPAKLVFRKEYHKPTGETHFIAYRKDPAVAGKTLAHEIGHMDDWYPDKTMARGNILGRIGKLKKYIGEYLKESPTAKGEVLTEADMGRLRKEATQQKLDETTDQVITETIVKEIPRFEETGVSPETILDLMRGRLKSEVAPEVYEFLQKADTLTKKEVVKQALKDLVDERVPKQKKQVGVDRVEETVSRTVPGRMPTQKEINQRFKELLAKEVAKRKLYEKKVITGELKNLTQQWKPFNDQISKEYTGYRYSSPELYADAVSVMLNDPQLLRETAPTFSKAMDNYMDVRPEFRDTLQEIVDRYQNPDAVQNKRLQDIYEMQQRGHEALAESQKRNLTETKSFSDTVMRWLFDKNQDILKYVRKNEKSGDPARVKQARQTRYNLEELQYISSEASDYVRSATKDVIEPLLRNGISVDDLGAYLFARHVQENRTEIFSAKGHTAETAGKLLTQLEKKLGSDKFAAVQEAGNRYRQIREDRIIPRIEASQIATPELIDIIKNRKDYARMSVQHWLDKKFGAGATSRFFKQIGSLKDVQNPFIATMLQDLSLLRAAHLNTTKTSVVDMFMQDQLVAPAEMKRGEAVKPNDPSKALFTIMRQGKPVTYVVPKVIADNFEYTPFEANQVAKIANIINQPFRAILVSKNPVWMIRNVFRDFRTTLKNIPEVKFHTMPALLKAYKQAYGEVWKDVWRSDRSRDLQEMARQRMLVTDRVFGTKERTYDDEMMRLADEFQIDMVPEINSRSNKSYGKLRSALVKLGDTKVGKKSKAAWEGLDRLGRVSEVGGKLAGFKFLKAQGTRSPEEIAHIVRTRIGTPDYKRQGKGQALTNNIFMFSNVNKEGLRSALESFNEDRAAYIWKTILYNVAPKLVLAAAASQIPAVKDIVRGFTDYEKDHYTVIPVMKTENGNSVGLMIPEDYEGQFWGAAVNKMIRGDITGKEGILAEAWQQNPYSLHPLLNIGGNLLDYYIRGINPVDDFRGTQVLPESVAIAGGKEAAGELAKYAWNNLGGSLIYRFQQGELERESSGLKKLMQYPGFNLLRSFMVVTNSGQAEQYRKISDAVEKEDRSRALMARRRIETHINENEYSASLPSQVELWKQLRQEKLLPDNYTPKQFLSWYSDVQSHGKEDPRIVAISYAGTNRKKAALLRAYKNETTPQQFRDLLGDLIARRLVGGEAIYEMQKGE